MSKMLPEINHLSEQRSNLSSLDREFLEAAQRLHRQQLGIDSPGMSEAAVLAGVPRIGGVK